MTKLSFRMACWCGVDRRQPGLQCHFDPSGCRPGAQYSRRPGDRCTGAHPSTRCRHCLNESGAPQTARAFATEEGPAMLGTLEALATEKGPAMFSTVGQLPPGGALVTWKQPRLLSRSSRTALSTLQAIATQADIVEPHFRHP
jgi:hypothetical protein